MKDELIPLTDHDAAVISAVGLGLAIAYAIIKRRVFLIYTVSFRENPKAFFAILAFIICAFGGAVWWLIKH